MTGPVMQRVSSVVSKDIANYLINQQTWGGIIYNAKAYGAKGDGHTDDTAAINKAIIVANAAGGGIVKVPGGTYMIQGATGSVTYEGQGGGIKVLSNVLLELDSDTILKQIPTTFANYNIVYFDRAKNAGIKGGIIQGERSEHLGVGGEFGYGIGVFSSENITINDLTCKDMWGDGVVWQVQKDVRNDPSIPLRDKQNKNLTMDNVTCDNNRRQGMSIESVLVGSITNSRFNNTSGTAPSCGIDIEPFTSEKLTEDLKISGCHFENNDQFGVMVLNATSKRIIIDDSTFKGNKSVEGQIGSKNSTDLTISSNILNCSGYGGIKLTLSRGCIVNDNRVIDGPIAFYGSEDISCDDNKIAFETVTPFNFMVVAKQDGVDSKDVRITNNTMKSVVAATSHAILIDGKVVIVNNNTIENALQAINSSGSGTIFEFCNNFVIDMSSGGINVGDGSTSKIDNNTFSGICYNNDAQSIVRVRDNAVANINNNLFYKNRLGGGDLGTGRPGSYIRIETMGVVNAFNNSIDTLALTNLGTLSTVIGRDLQGSATYDPPSLADGVGTTTTVTVTGAVLGDYAIASFSRDLQGITVTAWISAANTVSVRFQNETGGTLDLSSGTIRTIVKKAT